MDRIETKFEQTGTLEPPGLIGRLVRLAMGGLLLWSLYALLTIGWPRLVAKAPPGEWNWWLYMVLAFWATPYVVNIGLTKSWRRRPQHVLLAAGGLAVLVDMVLYGSWWAPPLGAVTWIWLVYFSAHLGISFLLSALIATPGCEMRAIPHLWTKVTGRPTKEHYCPGFLDPIDRWEARSAHR
ncbi:MAG: hypothetical protein ACE5HP_02230 [Gemmatimonadota bacterium]